MGKSIANKQNINVSFLFIFKIGVYIVALCYEQSVYPMRESIGWAKLWINGFSEYSCNPKEVYSYYYASLIPEQIFSI